VTDIANPAIAENEEIPHSKQAPPRPTQAQRSESMRSRLSEAAYQVIAERGHSGLRMAAVAQQAGVSPGALLHHFPDKDSVTLAAIRHALSIARNNTNEKLAHPITKIDELLDLMLEDFRSFFLGDQFWVALGITLDATKTSRMGPQLRQIVTELRQPIYGEWAQRLMALGWNENRATQIVRTAAALISGGAIRMLWAERDEITEEIERQWRQTIIDEHHR
jgi:AcrR family transcriptional regulator